MLRNVPFTPLPTGCWIRGKVFDKYVQECCDESLYEDKIREELDAILQSLKEHYRQNYPEKEKITDINAQAQLHQLIEYFEILLSITERDGKFYRLILANHKIPVWD